MKKIIYLFAFICMAFAPPEEDVITLINPSFEGTAGVSVAIGGWASFTPDSSPDLLPGAWGEMHPANHGSTCLGLVVRKDGTGEDIGQFLAAPLERGVCYKMSMDLAKADHYAKYNKPCRVRIWGGTAKGKKEQMLASSPLISHSDWKRYKMSFVPSQKYVYITLEAYYAPGAIFKYQGNILIDNVSTIERCIRA